MRTIKDYTTEPEPYDEQRKAGRYNPAIKLTAAGQCVTIGAGWRDELDVFEESGELYVLSRNPGLGYAGLEVFRDGDTVADTFTDTGQLADYINGLSPIWAAKRLQNWTDYRD